MDDAEFQTLARANPSAAQAYALWGIAKNLELLNEKIDVGHVVEAIVNLTEVIEKFQFPTPVAPVVVEKKGMFSKK
jgi:hypothetical protein